jgi:hypothetical protein
LTAALKYGYETSWETARSRNLLAFCLYKLDAENNIKRALDEVSGVAQL